jgi:hypothetical protein
MGYQRREIVSVMIHVVAVCDLRRPAMAPAIMGDDAIAVSDEEQHLRVPIIGRHRPAVAEHDGLALPPIFVEDVDAVFGSDRAHF